MSGTLVFLSFAYVMVTNFSFQFLIFRYQSGKATAGVIEFDECIIQTHRLERSPGATIAKPIGECGTIKIKYIFVQQKKKKR